MKGFPVRISHVAFFCVFMVAGFWMGRRSGGVARAYVEHALGLEQVSAAVDYPLPEAVKRTSSSNSFDLAGGMGVEGKDIQRNVLLILVDDLQTPQPTLLGVWMTMYLEGSNRYTFLPVYPSEPAPTSDQLNPSQTLREVFSLQPDGSPGIPFVATLRVRDLWWNGYVMVDLTGLLTLSEGLDKIDPQLVANLSNRAQLIGQPALTSGSQALVDQALLVQAYCRRASLGVRPGRLSEVLAGLHGHLQVDFDLPAMAGEWMRQAQTDSGITCEFPTLINQINAQ